MARRFPAAGGTSPVPKATPPCTSRGGPSCLVPSIPSCLGPGLSRSPPCLQAAPPLPGPTGGPRHWVEGHGVTRRPHPESPCNEGPSAAERQVPSQGPPRPRPRSPRGAEATPRTRRCLALAEGLCVRRLLQQLGGLPLRHLRRHLLLLLGQLHARAHEGDLAAPREPQRPSGQPPLRGCGLCPRPLPPRPPPPLPVLGGRPHHRAGRQRAGGGPGACGRAPA